MQSQTITIPEFVEVQATGCQGASSYRPFALQNGYTHIEVLNWTSSAGDWQFIISKNGYEWQILNQENNYPRPGFSHYIDSELFDGTAEEVLDYISMIYG